MLSDSWRHAKKTWAVPWSKSKGRFHKLFFALHPCANHRDSSIHLRPVPTPNFCASKKLLKSWAYGGNEFKKSTPSGAQYRICALQTSSRKGIFFHCFYCCVFWPGKGCFTYILMLSHLFPSRVLSRTGVATNAWRAKFNLKKLIVEPN